jgi:hypothetical protein
MNMMGWNQSMKIIGRGVKWFRCKWYDYQLTSRIWGFTIMELLVITILLILVTI